VSSKITVKLNKALCQRAVRIAEHAGYSSVEEFIEHALEKELAHFEESDSKEEVIKKLQGLGYLK
jgi:metal-responsive CopG/Arc/MetJ family transcriptional regulator